jgi:hypothetical protein
VRAPRSRHGGRDTSGTDYASLERQVASRGPYDPLGIVDLFLGQDDVVIADGVIEGVESSVPLESPQQSIQERTRPMSDLGQSGRGWVLGNRNGTVG